MLARDDGELGDDGLAVEGELAERLRVDAHDGGGGRLAAARLLPQPRAEPVQHVARGRGRRGPRHGSRVSGGPPGGVARVWGRRDGERGAEACGRGAHAG